MNLELFSVPLFIGNVDLKKIKMDVEMGEAWLSKTPSSFHEKNTLDPKSGEYLVSVIIKLLEEKYHFFTVSLMKIWRNEYSDNDFQEPHIHLGSQFSFILYEKVVTPHTIFINPAKYLIHATMGYYENWVMQQFEPQVKKGQIIVFPSFIEHMVNKNSDQVTISGNLNVRFMNKEEIKEKS